MKTEFRIPFCPFVSSLHLHFRGWRKWRENDKTLGMICINFAAFHASRSFNSPETVSVTVILKKRVKQKSEMGVFPSRATTIFKLNWDPFISSPQSPPYDKNDAYLYLNVIPDPSSTVRMNFLDIHYKTSDQFGLKLFTQICPDELYLLLWHKNIPVTKLFSLMKLTFPPMMINSFRHQKLWWRS